MADVPEQWPQDDVAFEQAIEDDPDGMAFSTDQLCRVIVYLAGKVYRQATISEDVQDCIAWCQDWLSATSPSGGQRE